MSEELKPEEFEELIYVCPCCGHEGDPDKFGKYCPSCGADLIEYEDWNQRF